MRPIAASKLSKSTLATRGSLYVLSSQLFVKALSENGILVIDPIGKFVKKWWLIGGVQGK